MGGRFGGSGSPCTLNAVRGQPAGDFCHGDRRASRDCSWLHLVPEGGGEQTSVLRKWLRREALQSRQYRELFEKANDAILVHEVKSGIILDCNRQACQLYGWNRNALVGSSLKTLTNDIDLYEEEIRRVQKGKGRSGFTAFHSRKDGRYLQVFVSLSMVDYVGKMAVLSFNRDVTEQQEVAEALHRCGCGTSGRPALY
jgi:PAS domain S-box-containing protein